MNELAYLGPERIHYCPRQGDRPESVGFRCEARDADDLPQIEVQHAPVCRGPHSPEASLGLSDHHVWILLGRCGGAMLTLRFFDLTRGDGERLADAIGQLLRLRKAKAVPVTLRGYRYELQAERVGEQLHLTIGMGVLRIPLGSFAWGELARFGEAFIAGWSAFDPHAYGAKIPVADLR